MVGALFNSEIPARKFLAQVLFCRVAHLVQQFD